MKLKKRHSCNVVPTLWVGVIPLLIGATSSALAQMNSVPVPPLPLNDGLGSSLDSSKQGSSVSASPDQAVQGDASGNQQELISLEYRNAPLMEVIRSLADAANLNITLSAEVEKGSPVSIRLTKVTYEQALKAILDTYKFGAVFENGILKIDTVANLTLQREEKLKERESAWKTLPTKRLVWQVNYAKATDLVGLLSTMLKGYAEKDSRFSIVADKRTNKVIIQGIADALVEAKGILENLDRRKQQVLIEARIVEASSELSKTLSVTWGTRFGFDGNRGLANGLVFPNSLSGNIGGAGALGSSAPGPGLATSSTQLGSMQFSVGSINNLINIDAVLRAYETESLANVIASPRVVVQDQEKALIKEDVTLRRGILGPDGKPADRDTVANLELSVKPQVTSDNTLELDIEVQRQTPTNAPTDPVQGSIKRQANTKLIVSNGETAVIGGLYQTQKFKGQGRIPFLGRLPLIGALFRTNEEQSFRSELMVLITPRILPGGTPRNSARTDLPLPGNSSSLSNGRGLGSNSNNNGDFGNSASNAAPSNGSSTGSNAPKSATSGNSAKANAASALPSDSGKGKSAAGGGAADNFGGADDFGVGDDSLADPSTAGTKTAKSNTGAGNAADNLNAGDDLGGGGGGNSETGNSPGPEGGEGNFNNLNGGNGGGGSGGNGKAAGTDNLNNLNGGDL